MFSQTDLIIVIAGLVLGFVLNTAYRELKPKFVAWRARRRERGSLIDAIRNATASVKALSEAFNGRKFHSGGVVRSEEILRSDCNKNDAYPNCRYTGEVHAPVGFGHGWWMEHRTFVKRNTGKIVLIPCVRDGIIQEVKCTEFSPAPWGHTSLSVFRDKGCAYFVGKTLEHFYEKARRNALYAAGGVVTSTVTINPAASAFQREVLRSLAKGFGTAFNGTAFEFKSAPYSSIRAAERAKRDAVLRDAIPARIERELFMFDDKWKQSSRVTDTMLDRAVRTCRAVRRRFGDVLAELRAAKSELSAAREENLALQKRLNRLQDENLLLHQSNQGLAAVTTAKSQLPRLPALFTKWKCTKVPGFKNVSAEMLNTTWTVQALRRAEGNTDYVVYLVSEDAGFDNIALNFPLESFREHFSRPA